MITIEVTLHRLYLPPFGGFSLQVHMTLLPCGIVVELDII
nr:MAG TPA: hypothetical protein [Caudoviricetes sp.]